MFLICFILSQGSLPSGTSSKPLSVRHVDEIRAFAGSHAHLEPGSATLRAGTKVRGGDVIGRVGRTGNTPKTGDTHLHFEVRIGSGKPAIAGGKTSNPLKLLPGAKP